jgi:hypothetical protein
MPQNCFWTRVAHGRMMPRMTNPIDEQRDLDLGGVFERGDPFALTVDQARAALELIAFRRLGSLEPVVAGSPGQWTVEELAFRILGFELFDTSVRAFALSERLAVVETALGIGRN